MIVTACIITAIICSIVFSITISGLRSQIKYHNRYQYIANTLMDSLMTYVYEVYGKESAKSIIENAVKLANNRTGIKIEVNEFDKLIDDFMDDIKEE